MAKPRHQLTATERRRGGRRSVEVRREQGKSFRQQLADKIDERADELIEKLLADDSRVVLAALDQAFGKPTARLEHTGADGAAIEIEGRQTSLGEVLDVLKAAGADGG